MCSGQLFAVLQCFVIAKRSKIGTNVSKHTITYLMLEKKSKDIEMEINCNLKLFFCIFGFLENLRFREYF